ncbi:cation efflux protein [Basidiobolus meristosporus CBS 931.73]|uniref:Cation efflux protein n=1 Tax=Basidiobolus meristosporus CBS 931.73 TaxID=1314790 RepID=A0A1Y1Y402_9FUNG|nr:cation efflux protein [Basidiobolus meristosporus CBS 931.73]|eukprot:ORX92761.1 cation efflux protein [Basidiobolus meristosporus CBS 931.73]
MERTTRITILILLTTTFFFVEIIVGYVVGSIALVADSFHMLSDLLSLCVALYAIKLSKRGHSSQYTYGWQRAEILGALLNGVFLIALCFSIFVEAIQRFFQPQEIENPVLILIVGGLGLLVNLIGLFLFHEHGHSHSHDHAHTKPLHAPASIIQTADEVRRIRADAEHQCQVDEDISLLDSTDPIPLIQTEHKHEEKKKDGGHLNMHGVFLHVLGDALGSIAVIVSSLVIWKCEFPQRFLLDPIISLVITGLILAFSLPLVKSTCFILLQGVPSTIPVDLIQGQIQDLSGVISVHELHVWQLSDVKTIASVHIHIADHSIYMKVAKSIKDLLHTYGIHSVTIQPEFPESTKCQDTGLQDYNEDCLLRCSPTCDQSTCCPAPPSKNVQVVAYDAPPHY